jgi:NAD(P)-dependent dehydrogenase (short-subunit alcohol dehydrogenase family)
MSTSTVIPSTSHHGSPSSAISRIDTGRRGNWAANRRQISDACGAYICDSTDHERKSTIMSDLSDKTTMVVGASRGLGRGIAAAFDRAGAPVVAVARSGSELAELADSGVHIRAETADAADPAAAWRLMDLHRPNVLVLVAGANPVMRPLQNQTWETFSLNWHSDVKIAFTWLREALLQPLPPNSRVIVVSSGAAINGSPVSGGYAGAKSTQRFIAAYAQDESDRAGLGITFTTVMPRMTPFGAVGRRGIRAYAARSGIPEETFLGQLGPVATADVAGSALVDLVSGDPSAAARGYVLTGTGLQLAA